MQVASAAARGGGTTALDHRVQLLSKLPHYWGWEGAPKKRPKELGVYHISNQKREAKKLLRVSRRGVFVF